MTCAAGTDGDRSKMLQKTNADEELWSDGITQCAGPGFISQGTENSLARRAILFYNPNTRLHLGRSVSLCRSATASTSMECVR